MKFSVEIRPSRFVLSYSSRGVPVWPTHFNVGPIPSVTIPVSYRFGPRLLLHRFGGGILWETPLLSDRPPFGVSWKSRSLCGCLNTVTPGHVLDLPGSTFTRSSPTLLWIPTRPISLFGFLYSMNRIGSAVRHHMVSYVQPFIERYNPTVHGLYEHETMPSSLNR